MLYSSVSLFYLGYPLTYITVHILYLTVTYLHVGPGFQQIDSGDDGEIGG